MEIGLRHAGSALRALAREAAGAAGPREAGRAFFDAYRRYATEMAAVPWLAIERFGAELASPPESGPSPHEASLYTIDGKPLALPVRVHDAAQGFAVFAVPRRPVETVLADKGLPFSAVDLGGGTAALAIFALRHRVSDLGSFAEIGVGFFVAPWRDPLGMGLYVLEYPVNQRLPCEAGKVIWGYTKMEDDVDFAWGETDVAFVLKRRRGGNHVLTITFPRGGGGASARVPFATYTVLDGTPQRVMFTRSGRGERIRAGGEGVALVLGDAGANESDALWKLLRDLDLPAAHPMLHAWTEHVSGEFGPPRAIE